MGSTPIVSTKKRLALMRFGTGCFFVGTSRLRRGYFVQDGVTS